MLKISHVTSKKRGDSWTWMENKATEIRPHTTPTCQCGCRFHVLLAKWEKRGDAREHGVKRSHFFARSRASSALLLPATLFQKQCQPCCILKYGETNSERWRNELLWEGSGEGGQFLKSSSPKRHVPRPLDMVPLKCSQKSWIFESAITIINTSRLVFVLSRF